MKQMKRITLRLCLEKPNDKEIADFLANIDRKKYHTVNSAIKSILYEHIHVTTTKINKSNDIVSIIKSTLEAEVPKLFNAFMSGVCGHGKKEKIIEPVFESNPADDDIDMDFIGG